MKELRILFMGTPSFAVGILKPLLEANHNIVGVVTAPDRPAGRGRKLKASAVKEFALENQLEVLQPLNLKAAAFQKDLERWQPNLIIVVAFRMLPKKVWSFPAHGTLNLHASLLPQYRGAAPINWALINGEQSTGVSTFFIDEKIDTGALLLQEETTISPEENAGNLHDKLMALGSNLVLKTIDGIGKGNLHATPQAAHGPLKTAHKLTKESIKIDWQMGGDEIHNHIRGLSPFPVAWCYFTNHGEKTTCKIHSAKFQQKEHAIAKGKVFEEEKQLMVAVQNGFIKIECLQLPGKRKMEAIAFLNGTRLGEDAHMS